MASWQKGMGRRPRWLATLCVAFVCTVLCVIAYQASVPEAAIDASTQPVCVESHGGSNGVAADAGSSSSSSSDATSPDVIGEGVGEPEGDEGGHATLTWENGAKYIADEVLVELSPEVPVEELNARLADVDAVATDAVSDDDVSLGWAKLQLAPGADVASAISELEAVGAVASAQPNFVYHLLDDDVAGSSAASGRTGVSDNGADPVHGEGSLTAGSSLSTQSSHGWQLQAINAYDAWSANDSFSEGLGVESLEEKHASKVTVAIIDSGCDTTHVDLKDNIIATYNALDGGRNVTDEFGHGTHIAGIISASADNGVGVRGVSNDAWILPIKVMKGNEASTASLVKAYDFILKNAERYNIRVVNMSLGDARQRIGTGNDAATLRAIDKAYQAGILSVLSAGNDEATVPYYCFPCDFSENSVGVINVNQNYAEGMPDPSSNFNKQGEKTKDLSAPGTNIYSTYLGGLYTDLTGSSMATPVVAGVAALVFEANPGLDAGEAKSVLCSTAADLVRTSGSSKYNVGFDDYTGYGLVQADKAVEGASGNYLSGRDTMRVGSTLRLTVPQPGSGTWTWKSDKPAVATVDVQTGRIVGVGHGEAVISATSGNVTLKRTVIVYDVGMRGKTTVAVGETTTLTAEASPVALWTYSSSNKAVATVGATSGVVTGKKAGTVTITATLTACPDIKLRKDVKVVVLANPMAVRAVPKTVTGYFGSGSSASKVTRRAVTVSGAIAFTKRAKGSVTYAKLVSGSSKQLFVDKKNGRVIVRAGTKRGTHYLRVRVSAAGTAGYKPATKTVTVKIIVK